MDDNWYNSDMERVTYITQGRVYAIGAPDARTHVLPYPSCTDSRRPESGITAISEIKRLTGVTTSTIGKMIGVSPETITGWHNNKLMPWDSEARVQEILAVVRKLPGSTVAEREKALFYKPYDRRSVYLQLAYGASEYSIKIPEMPKTPEMPETPEDTHVSVMAKISPSMIYGLLPAVVGAFVWAFSNDINSSTLASVLTAIVLPVVVHFTGKVMA